MHMNKIFDLDVTHKWRFECNMSLESFVLHELVPC